MRKSSQGLRCGFNSRRWHHRPQGHDRKNVELYLYKYHENCGRSGSLDGIFIVDERGKACLEALMTSEVDVQFGEVLGKHSDVSCSYKVGKFKPEDIPQADISAVLRVLGSPLGPDGAAWCTISGFNPLDYVDSEEMAYVDGSWVYERFLSACKGEDVEDETEAE